MKTDNNGLIYWAGKYAEMAAYHPDELLNEICNEQNIENLCKACEAAVYITEPHKDLETKLIELIRSHNNNDVKIAAGYGLVGHFGSKEVVECIGEFICSENDRIKNMAKHVLGKITYRSAEQIEIQSIAKEEMIKALKPLQEALNELNSKLDKIKNLKPKD